MTIFAAAYTRTAWNRSVFRLQMQLWPCYSNRKRYNSDKLDPKRRFQLKKLVARGACDDGHTATGGFSSKMVEEVG
jgi:hypothetical protein